jgi:hypothetical protein
MVIVFVKRGLCSHFAMCIQEPHLFYRDVCTNISVRMTDMSFCLLSMLISIEKELNLILVILSECVSIAVSGVKCSTR